MAIDKTELKILLKTLDKIITSESVELKTAFREIMVIAALSEPGGDIAGPLMDLLNRVEALEMKEASRNARNQSLSDYQRSWVFNGNGGAGGAGGVSSNGGSTGSGL